MAFPTGWARKTKITIPDAQISGNNNNFSVLITKYNLPAEMLDGGSSAALYGGGDVRFSEDSAGATRLDLEVVTFVTGNTPDVELWVKIPTLNTGTAKDIWVWYKKSGEIQPAATEAFGRNAVWSDYERVFHMGSAVDSSGNGDLVLIGSPTTVSGVMGGGTRFNGTSQRADLGWNGITQDFTLSAVMRAPNLPTDSGSGPINGNSPSLDWNVNGGDNPKTWLTTGSWTGISFGALIANTDYWLSTVYDGATFAAFVDGISVASAAKTGNLVDKVNFTIASHAAAPTIRFLEADIFFVAITLLPRSAGWLLTEYNNQNSPATFATAGIPEAIDVVGVALTIQRASSGLISDNIIPSQIHTLNAMKTTHNFTSGNVVSGLGVSVSIQYMKHAVSSQMVNLSQVQNITVSNGLQLHAANSLIMSQIQTIANSNSQHNVSGDSLILSQVQTLTMGGNRHAIKSDGVILAQLQALVSQNATHGLSSDVAGLFDPTAFSPHPNRTHKVARANQASSTEADDRTIRPTNNRTLRI